MRILPTWQLYADHIVIADQNSTDGTRAFLAKHGNVTVVANEGRDIDEPTRINLLLSAARRISERAVLLFLDADETLSANVMTSLEWRSFQSGPEGTTGLFKWIQLWRSVKHYVARGNAGTPIEIPFAFVDDGRPFEAAGTMHGPRGPGMHRPTRRFHFNDVVNLHFFLTNRDMYRKKQNWYKLVWRKKGGKYFYTNRNHMIYDGICADQCAPTPTEWRAGYEREGLDLSSSESPALTWYDVEILQHIAVHGARSLWLLDIWNQDWEHARQLALAEGHRGLPVAPIVPPPRTVTAYTDWTLGRASFGRLAHSGGRFLKRKVLP